MLVVDDKVTPAWKGRTVVIIATGPSLTEQQVERVRAARAADQVRVIAINDAYQIAPWADVLFHPDERWRCWQVDGYERRWPWVTITAEEQRAAFASFAGERVSIAPGGVLQRAERTQYLRPYDSSGMSPEPGKVATGGNSAHMTLNIAALAGAARILLLGVDGKKGKATHAFGEHPNGGGPPYSRMGKDLPTIARALRAKGIRAINCTPGSAVTCFEQSTIERELPAVPRETETTT